MFEPTSSLAPLAPLTCLCVSIAIYAWAVSARHRRWTWLAPLLFSQYLAFSASNRWPNNGIDSLWGLLVCIWISESLSVLFLEDQSLLVSNDLSPAPQPWYWKAWMTWNNPRLIGTPREEDCTPRSFYGCQSRAAFARVRLIKLVAYWICSQYLQPMLIPGAFMPFEPSDFDSVRQTYFRRILSENNPITARETTLRATFAIFWAWGAYVMVDAAHTALSIVFVIILRMDHPHQWPPIYGHLRHMSSLRGFWGKFWHRLVVLPYSNCGKIIAERVLGIRPGCLPHKMIVAFTIFLISGMVHAAVAWQLGDRCGWHLDICWFCLNFVASTFESAFCSAALRKAITSNATSSRSPVPIIQKTLGFIWVFGFFFWSVPKWQYPKVYCLFGVASMA